MTLLRTCKCGRKIPRDWEGDDCFYCWLGAPATEQEIIVYQCKRK